MYIERAFRRYDVRWTLQYRFAGGDWIGACSGNVGAMGLWVAAPGVGTDRVGQKVEVKVEVPGADSLVLSGEVAWSNDTPAGRELELHGGFGVRLLKAHKRWFSHMEALDEQVPPPSAAASGAPPSADDDWSSWFDEDG